MMMEQITLNVNLVVINVSHVPILMNVMNVTPEDLISLTVCAQTYSMMTVLQFVLIVKFNVPDVKLMHGIV